MCLDERGQRLRIDPGHPGGPDQGSVGLGDLPGRDLDPPDDLGDGAPFERRRLGKGDRSAGEGSSNLTLRIGGDDHDWNRPARPGHVREPSYPRLPIREGERPFGTCGKNDGGNSHPVILPAHGGWRLADHRSYRP